MRDPVDFDLALTATVGPLTQRGLVTALCRDDRCPWKHAARSHNAAVAAAVAHVKRSGHAVAIDRSQAQLVRPA